MTVAYGGTAKEAGLDEHIIEPVRLQEIARGRGDLAGSAARRILVRLAGPF